MADMCYLCPLWPSRRDQIKLAWDRRTKPVFIQVSLSLSLSLDLAFSFFPPFQSLSWKGRENQGQANEHVKLQENKFPHTCPFRPTDSLKECSLVKPGNIWLVKTYGMFTWGPRLQSTFPFLSPLTHGTQIHVGNDGAWFMTEQQVHIVHVWVEENLIKMANGKRRWREWVSEGGRGRKWVNQHNHSLMQTTPHCLYSNELMRLRSGKKTIPSLLLSSAGHQGKWAVTRS